LLVDRGVVRVEDNEGCGTVGVTFEDSFGGGWDGKKEAELWTHHRVSFLIKAQGKGIVMEVVSKL
jgi:hypothetical protein